MMETEDGGGHEKANHDRSVVAARSSGAAYSR